MKRTIVVIAAVLAVLAGVWYFTKPAGDPSATDAALSATSAGTSGSADSKTGTAPTQDASFSADAVTNGQQSASVAGGKGVTQIGGAGELEGGSASGKRIARDGMPGADGKSRSGKAGDSSAPKKKDKPGTGVLFGQITQDDGKVAADARVVILRFEVEDTDPKNMNSMGIPESLQAQMSDAKGQFRFENLAFGQFRVRAYKEGMYGVRTAGISEQNPTANVEMDIEAAGSIGGVVKNENGDPIANARIYPLQQKSASGFHSPRWSTLLSVTSDATGNFVVENLYEDEWTLCAEAKDYALSVSEFYKTGTTDAVITVRKGNIVSGTVIDTATDSPVPNLPVILTSTMTPRLRDDVVTEADGTFEGHGLPEGDYIAVVYENGYSNEGGPTRFLMSFGKDTTGLEVKVTHGSSISGRIYDASTQAAVPGIEVTAYGSGRSNDLPQWLRQLTASLGPVKSDSEGNYLIEGATEGQYQVAPQARGYVRDRNGGRKSVMVRAGEDVTGIDFPLSRGISISGRVVDAQANGVGSANVSANDGDSNYQSAVSRSDGSFEISGLMPTKTLNLSASRAGLATAKAGPLELTESGMEPVTLTLGGGGSIAGRLVDSNGQPVVRGTVIVLSKDTNTPKSGTSALGGAFAIFGLEPGNYTVFGVRAQNAYSPTPPADARTQEVALAEGEGVTDLDVVASDAGGLTIAGRVTNTSGQAIPNARVQTWNRNGQSSATSDADGNFELSGLAEGSFSISASAANYSYINLQAEAGATGVSIVLPGLGKVEGQVVMKGGAPVKDFKVTNIGGAMQQFSPEVLRYATSFHDEEGRFKLDSVNAGEATIVAQAEGTAPAMQIIDVKPGDTPTTLTLVLEPGVGIAGVVVGPNGSPVSNAAITAVPATSEHGTWIDANSSQRQALTFTNAQGEFSYDGLWGESMVVVALTNNFCPAMVTVTPGSSAATNIQLVMGTGGQVEGHVLLDGQPQQEAWVSVAPVQNQGGFNLNLNRSARTDAQGAFKIDSVMPGEMQVSAGVSIGGNRSRGKNQRITIQEGQVTTVDFDFVGQTAALEGTVTMPANAQGWVSVEVATEDGSTESSGIQVSASGQFRIDNLPPGHATVTAFAQVGQSGSQSPKKEVDLAANSVTQIELEVPEPGQVQPAQ
jgi:hypothetical protein